MDAQSAYHTIHFHGSEQKPLSFAEYSQVDNQLRIDNITLFLQQRLQKILTYGKDMIHTQKTHA